MGDSEKLLLNKLLLERISLAGICRACGVSESWLLQYIRALYSTLPDDLQADLTVPELEPYLAARMEEEVSRLEVLKKFDCPTGLCSSR